MENQRLKLQRRIAVLRQLPNPDRHFQHLRIFLFMLTVPWLLRMRLPRLKALLNREQKQEAREEWDDDEIQSIIDDVDSALQFGRPFFHWRSRCLFRGITLYYFLRKAGLDVGLCFGVSDTGDALLDGHCWLVRDGEPLSEPTDPRQSFTAVYSFPEG